MQNLASERPVAASAVRASPRRGKAGHHRERLKKRKGKARSQRNPSCDTICQNCTLIIVSPAARTTSVANTLTIAALGVIARCCLSQRSLQAFDFVLHVVDTLLHHCVFLLQKCKL
jgi:hypothetical protein